MRGAAQTRFSDVVNAPLFNIPAQIVFRTGKSPTTNDRVPDRHVIEKVFVEEDPMVVGRCWPSVFYEGLLPEATVGEDPERALVAGRAISRDRVEWCLPIFSAIRLSDVPGRSACSISRRSRSVRCLFFIVAFPFGCAMRECNGSTKEAAGERNSAD